QTALSSNLSEGITCAQCKEIGASIRRIKDAQAIFAVADLEVCMVNAIDEALIAGHAIRIEHVWDLVINIKLPVSDCQGQVEGARWERCRVSRIIYDVHTC